MLHTGRDKGGRLIRPTATFSFGSRLSQVLRQKRTSGLLTDMRMGGMGGWGKRTNTRQEVQLATYTENPFILQCLMVWSSSTSLGGFTLVQYHMAVPYRTLFSSGLKNNNNAVQQSAQLDQGADLPPSPGKTTYTIVGSLRPIIKSLMVFPSQWQITDSSSAEKITRTMVIVRQSLVKLLLLQQDLQRRGGLPATAGTPKAATPTTSGTAGQQQHKRDNNSRDACNQEQERQRSWRTSSRKGPSTDGSHSRDYSHNRHQRNVNNSKNTDNSSIYSGREKWGRQQQKRLKNWRTQQQQKGCEQQ